MRHRMPHRVCTAPPRCSSLLARTSLHSRASGRSAFAQLLSLSPSRITSHDYRPGHPRASFTLAPITGYGSGCCTREICSARATRPIHKPMPRIRESTRAWAVAQEDTHTDPRAKLARRLALSTSHSSAVHMGRAYGPCPHRRHAHEPSRPGNVGIMLAELLGLARRAGVGGHVAGRPPALGELDRLLLLILLLWRAAAEVAA